MRILLKIAISIVGCSLLFACVDIAPMKETRLVDSLNHVSYAFHYKNLDSSYLAARLAYESATLYGIGKAEATNNLGFVAFMRMDFDLAEQCFNEVYSQTQSELERLIADVGMMKIYQRTAMYKEFYDYRNKAIRRIRRIDEDKSLFVAKHERTRLNFAYSEFSIVSTIYYYYLQQLPEARASIYEIKPETELVGDTGQTLYYHYIKGSTSLSGGDSPERRLLNEFDELYLTWQLASEKEYLYFEGNSLQGLANLMIPVDNFELAQLRRSHALGQLGFPVDSALPLRLAQKALEKFYAYNDIYQIAGAYVSIGRYLNEHGHYAAALDTLTKALSYVNLHHRLYYKHLGDTVDFLEPYVERDTMYTEVIWIKGMENDFPKTVKTVPEWISRIREQLSVSYAGLGMKFQSDYNRSIYMEILKYTRQNKELESRYLVLQQESKKLNMILLFIVIGFILLMLFLWTINKHSKQRNRVHTERLQMVLDICQKVTASIPSDITVEEDITRAIVTSILPDLKKLVGASGLFIRLSGDHTDDNNDPPHLCPGVTSDFNLNVPDKEQPIGLLTICTAHPLSKDDRTLMNVITPYIAWAIDNGMTFISLGDERERLEKQRYIFEQHIAKGKRENLIKKSCLSIVNGIIPYIDRIINEVYKLRKKEDIHQKKIKAARYQYIEELVTTINEYNDILALWIKMKQGSLSLNVENFVLDDLFELVKKGRKTFEMRAQTFDVESTDAIVKADRALTLFMINTLTENARKYTQPGGTIKVYARSTDKYVEISVEDSGRGLSPDDIALIKDENVYDSRMIGMDDGEETEELKNMKGSGFGLMNCKGIIEKYRKTNPLFQVCLFSVDSQLGKGSRFYFRLPPGVRKTWNAMLFLLLSLGVGSCEPSQESNDPVRPDSLTITLPEDYDNLTEKALAFTDTAYYCNVMEDYELALQYVDSAMTYLNMHYKKYSDNPQVYMTLVNDGTPAELIWWENQFRTDYYTIMDIRNEAAISLLARKCWDAYSYNNRAFTALYKLNTEDRSLEAYCRELEGSTINKIVGIILCALLLLSYLIVYYTIYIRKRLNNRWNLEQVLEINKNIFSSSLVRSEESIEALQREENTLHEIPRRIIAEAFIGINELLNVESLSLAVYNEIRQQFEFASTTTMETVPEMVRHSFESQQHLKEGCFQAFPLIVEVGDKHQTVGVLLVEQPENAQQEGNHLLLELIARYVAIVVFNAVVKLALRYRDIESAYEDTHRASWEDSMLHVQNMVLDNCLSTIKHETVYYPNKIKQIIEKLTSRSLSPEEEIENVAAISELIEYYKGVFTILSSCAARQLEEITFRRTTISVAGLLEYAQKYFRKSNKVYKAEIELQIDCSAGELQVLGDVNQLQFLFENLIDESFQYKEKGILQLHALPDEQFVRFLFTDTRREKSVEELNQLFYPSLERMTSGEKGQLKSTGYLVCKQIIRDHDEYVGRRGCRINAEPAPNGGFRVYFTIPKR